MTTEGSAEVPADVAAARKDLYWKLQDARSHMAMVTEAAEAFEVYDALIVAAERTRLEARLAEVEAGECDVCEEEGPRFRWYARTGEVVEVCEDCHGKSFAWLWDRVADLTALREAVRPLVEAAEWYADPQVYCHDDSECSPACHDEGFKARNALADQARLLRVLREWGHG